MPEDTNSTHPYALYRTVEVLVFTYPPLVMADDPGLLLISCLGGSFVLCLVSLRAWQLAATDISKAKVDIILILIQSKSLW